MAKVTILLATFNGARFLADQLDSLGRQDADWALWISDDGSTDGTKTMLSDFAQANPGRDIRVIDGPGRGSAANFLSLLTHPDLPDRPVALCDQDDVWLPHHLSRGLERLAGSAGVYACATLECDIDLGHPRLSRLVPPRTGFTNALVQNVVAGNTMVLSTEALRIVRAFPPAGTVPYHDWWIYLLSTAHGIPILIDPEPGLMYRQHDGNEMGASRGLAAFVKRFQKAFGGDYAIWLRANCNALANIPAAIAPGNTTTFEAFRRDLGRSGLGRMLRLRHAGIRRETRSGTILLYVAAALGRV